MNEIEKDEEKEYFVNDDGIIVLDENEDDLFEDEIPDLEEEFRKNKDLFSDEFQEDIEDLQHSGSIEERFEIWNSIYNKARELRSIDINKTEKILNFMTLHSKDVFVQGLAMYGIGELYEWGYLYDESFQRDIKSAISHYNNAISLGNANAHAALGYLYSIGEGVEQNDAMSILHYEFAASGDSLNAHLALGYRYHYGRGVSKNCERSVEHYELASQRIIDEIEKSGLHPVGRAARIPFDENHKKTDLEDENDVLEYYQYSSDRSDASSLITLGVLYLQGSPTVKRDFEKANRYFDEAIALESASAHALKGYLYQYGYAVALSEQTAIDYYKKALALDASNVYANSFIGKVLVRQGDYATGLNHLKIASQKGSPSAHIELAHLYYDGNGVERNYPTALHLYTQASKAGFVEASYQLARMYRFGLGITKSCENALALYKRIAEKGFRRDFLEPAYACYASNKLECAISLYELASELGYEVAQSNAAALYHLVDPATHHSATLRLLQAAAQQQSAPAHRLLGDYYYRGDQVNQSNTLAVAYYSAASTRRDAEATFSLAYMHASGLGVPRDPHLAKRYYDLTVQIEPAAALASFFALTKLGFEQFVDHLYVMTTPEYDGIEWGLGHEYRANWDTLLLAICCLLLGLLFLIRRFCLSE